MLNIIVSQHNLAFISLHVTAYLLSIYILICQKGRIVLLFCWFVSGTDVLGLGHCSCIVHSGGIMISSLTTKMSRQLQKIHFSLFKIGPKPFETCSHINHWEAVHH